MKSSSEQLQAAERRSIDQSKIAYQSLSRRAWYRMYSSAPRSNSTGMNANGSHSPRQSRSVGHDVRGALVLRQKWSRGQVEARLPNIPLIGMEACVGANHLSRKRLRGFSPAASI
jgi:hypothetical protein